MTVRTQLNAAHAQLNKKLRIDDFLSFSEKGVFLKNNSLNFIKFSREILQTAVKLKIEKVLKFNRGNFK